MAETEAEKERGQESMTDEAQERPETGTLELIRYKEKELELLRRENELLKRELDVVNKERALEVSTPCGENSIILGTDQMEKIIPEFNPGSHLGISAVQWLGGIENMRQIYAWDERTTLFYASSRLKEAARFWFNGKQREIKTWDDFKRKLTESFPTEVDESAIHMMLLNRRKRNNESVENYFYEVIDLAGKANLNEFTTIKYIISGLGDKNLMNVLSASNYNNLSDLLNKIKSYNSIIEQECSRRNMAPTTLQTPEPGTSKQFFKPYVQRQKLANDRDTSTHFFKPYAQRRKPVTDPQYNYHPKRNEKNQTCYRCGIQGHFAYQCNKRRPKENTKFSRDGQTVKRVRLSRQESGDELYKTVLVGGISMIAFIDLGSDCTTIKYEEVQKNCWNFRKANIELHGFAGGYCKTYGVMEKEIRIDEVVVMAEIVVVADEVQNDSMIIGRNVLDQPGISLIKEWGRLEIIDKRNETTQVNKIISEDKSLRQMKIYRRDLTAEDIKIEAGTEECKREELLKLVNEYRDCFALDLPELGKTNLLQMDIKLQAENIIKYKPYRIPYNLQDSLQQIIKELLDNDIIENSTSEFASPVLLVKKPNGMHRMCVDYRKVNEITMKENFPTPNVEEQLNSMLGKKVFISLDMMSGYYQIPIKTEVRHITAFITPQGHYQFKRIPFGLSNAPAVFMRTMSLLLKDFDPKEILCYMDDLLIVGSTHDRCIELLKDLLIVTRDAGLTFNVSKCSFFTKEIEHLGHVITETGIMPGEGKTKAVESFSVPKTIKEVRQFLGLTGYFRRFVKNYAHIASPLNKLLKKNAEFSWSDEEQKAFLLLKSELCKKPTLAIYNKSATHELHTDASSQGLAGVLIQVEENNIKRPVSFFSRATTEAERKYHSYELEALAVVASLERFKYYLMGKHFTVVTDCNSLKLTQGKRDLIPRIARWWLRIQEFDFELQYRPGSQMQHVDALSRSPCETAKALEEAGHRVMIIGSEEEDWISTLQTKDNEIKEIRDILTSQETKHPKRKNIEREYVLKNGRVYKKIDGGVRFVVPRGVRWRVIKSSHDDIGHFGIDRTLEHVRKTYWFPRMRDVIKKYIDSCLQCLYNARGNDETRYHLHTTPKSEIPFRTIHIDHQGPYPRSRKGNLYILAIVDAFTKYVILRAVRNTSTNPVIKTLEEVSQYFGLPRNLVSDRGTAFTARKFETFCQENGIKHTLIAVRTPRANGQVERYFRTIKAAVSSMTTREDGKDWDEHLPAIQWGLNSSKHRLTGQTPQKLLFAFQPENHLQNKLSLALSEDCSDDEEDIPLAELRERIRDKINQKQATVHEKYNTKHLAPKKYKEGDLVLIKADHAATGQSRKLLTRYKGPYLIAKTLGNDRYLITDTLTTQITRKPFQSVYAADKMKAWCDFENIAFGEITSDDDEQTE